MNVIFLDIDGVLNSKFWNEEHQKEISNGLLIDSDKVRLLQSLVREVQAQIVLHSGWKYWFDEQIEPINTAAEKLQNLLFKYDMAVSDITPDLATDEIKRTKKFSLVKADEILQWLAKHPTCNWIVIDDLDLHNEEIRKHQIMTDSNVGLTDEDVKKARELLGGR